MFAARQGGLPQRPAKNIFAGGRAMPVFSTDQSKFGGGSLRFTSATPNAFSVRPGNYTWGSSRGLQGGLQPGNSGEFTWEVFIYRITNNGEIQWWEAGSGGLSIGIKDGTGMWVGVSQQTYGITTTTGATTGVWQHFCATRDSGGTVRLYIDGTYKTQGSSGTYNGAATIGVNTCPFVGGQSVSPYLNGYMNELRISNINRYPVGGTNNITVPTAPFVNDGNTLLLVHGTQGPVDDNT
jgi:hypothetical protein